MTSLRANTLGAHREAEAEKLFATRVIENPKDVDSRLRLANFYASTSAASR